MPVIIDQVEAEMPAEERLPGPLEPTLQRQGSSFDIEEIKFELQRSEHRHCRLWAD